MSTTDDGISRRQATFDTDPVNLRKQGANITLPIIEGEKEIKLNNKENQEYLNDRTSKVINEGWIKNLTHVVDTKSDINLGVKAVSEKAKAHQRQEKDRFESDKKICSTNTVTVDGDKNSLKDKPLLKETNDTVAVGVKGINEKVKTKQKEQRIFSENNQKDATTKIIEKNSNSSGVDKTKVNTAESDSKLNVQKTDHLKAAYEKTKTQKSDNTSRNKFSPVAVTDKIRQQVNVKTDKKKGDIAFAGEDKGKLSRKEETIPVEKNSIQNSKYKDNTKTTILFKTQEKVNNVSRSEKEKEINAEKLPKHNKLQNQINSESVKKDIGQHKEPINIIKPRDDSAINHSKISHLPPKKDKKKAKTDKTKAKAGVSETKDTHAASGTTVAVAKGNSPKPEHENDSSQNKESVSKLTVGSAPRGTTLGDTEKSKVQKESFQKTTESNKESDHGVDSFAVVKSYEQKSKSKQISSDKDIKQSKTEPPKTTLDINLTQKKEIEESSIEYRSMEGRRGESYETIYAERNTLLKAETAYKRRIKQLEDEANDFLKHIDQLTSENTRLHARVEVLEGQLSSADIVSENATLKSKESSDNQISELKAQIIKLQTENQTANEELIKLKAELLNESRKLHILEKEKNSLAGSVTAVESEKLDEIQDIQKSISKLKRENNAQKDKIAELESKVESLEFENKTLSESLAQKKTELDELLGVMKDENKFDNEIKDLKNRVMKLEKEKKEIELKHNGEKLKLEEELSETKSNLEKSNTELNEIKSKTNELTSKNRQLSASNKTLTAACDSQKAEIDKLKAEIEQLKNELADLQKKLRDLKKETENATSSLKDTKTKLEDANKELQCIISEKEEQISKLIAIADELRTEKDAEKLEFEHEKDKFTAEIDRLKVFEKHMNTMEMELKTFVEKFEEAEKQKAKLSSQLEDKDYTISALEKQIFEFNLKMDTLTKRIGQLDREKRDMENEKREWEVKRDKMSDIEASNKRLMEENRRLRGSLEDKKIRDQSNKAEKLPRGREAWVEDAIPIATLQKAVFVENKPGKKKVQIAPEPVVQTRRTAFTKSVPARASKPPLPKKDLRTSLSPSRSLEDVRRSPVSPTDSSPSLPELKKEGRLTYGYGYPQGYSQIHRNRVRAAAHKRVY